METNPLSLRQELPYALAAILMAGVLAFYQLETRSFWSVDDEARNALVAREIARSGNIVPPQNSAGAPWAYPAAPTLISLAYLITGQQSEAVARTPSAAMSLLTLAVVGLAGSVLWGARAGIFSAGILATSLLFSFYARSARGEMTANLLDSLAILCFILAVKDAKSKRWIRLFWLFSGLAFYAGGLADPLILLTGAAYSAYKGSLGPERIMRLFDGMGVIIFLIALAPGAYYLWNTPALFPLLGPAAGSFDGIKEFALGLFSFFPWIIALPAVLLANRSAAGNSQRISFNFFVGIFAAALILALLGRPRPMLPHLVMAVLIAEYIFSSQRRAHDGTGGAAWVSPVTAHAIIVTPMIFFVGVTLFPYWSSAAPYPPTLSSLALLAAVYISHKSMGHFTESGSAWGVWMAAMTASFAFLVYFHLAIAPAVNRSMSHKVFFRQAAAFMEGESILAFYRYESAQARFYLNMEPIMAKDIDIAGRMLSQAMQEGKRIYFLTDAPGKVELEKSLGEGDTKPTVYKDSYFVPASAGMERERLYIFEYAPRQEPAAER